MDNRNSPQASVPGGCIDVGLNIGTARGSNVHYLVEATTGNYQRQQYQLHRRTQGILTQWGSTLGGTLLVPLSPEGEG